MEIRLAAGGRGFIGSKLILTPGCTRSGMRIGYTDPIQFIE
jgi:hypothetical protein